MPDLGYTSIGGSQTSSTYISASKFTAASSGAMTALCAGIFQYYGGTANVRTALYEDNAGDPGNFIAESSNEVPIDASSQFFCPSISANIVGGTTYWLAMQIDTANADIAFATPGDVSNQGAYRTGTTYGTWPATFSKDSFIDRKYSIYGPYTEGPGKVGSMLAMFQ